MAIGFSATQMVMYVSYAVAFWFGSMLVVWDPSFDRGTVFTVFFAVMTGSTALGAALPNFTSMAMAKGAASYVLGVINHVPYIDPYSRRGAVIRRPKGAIELSGVHFFYPLRPDIKVGFLALLSVCVICFRGKRRVLNCSNDHSQVIVMVM